MELCVPVLVLLVCTFCGGEGVARDISYVFVECNLLVACVLLVVLPLDGRMGLVGLVACVRRGYCFSFMAH